MHELNPCPFCGKTDSLKIADQYEMICLDKEYEPPESELDYTVVCSVHTGGCGAACGFQRTPDEAVAEWNQRRYTWGRVGIWRKPISISNRVKNDVKESEYNVE